MSQQYEPVKVSNYYGLRLATLVLRSLIVIAVFFIIGGIGWFSVQALDGRSAEPFVFGQYWLPRVSLLVFTGGLFAFMCFILAQLIDAQVEQAQQMRKMSENMSILLWHVKALYNEKRVKSGDEVPIDVKIKQG